MWTHGIPLRSRYEAEYFGTGAAGSSGEHDWEFVRRDADSLQQAIPGATKVIIAGAGMYPNLDDPGAVNAAVLDFLGAAGAGDAQ